MRVADDFLPSRMTTLISRDTRMLEYCWSGIRVRAREMGRRMLCLGFLHAVLRTLLSAAFHADGVEHAAHDVVADARQVLHAAAADDDHRVLLQIVADARAGGRHFHAVGEAAAGGLPERRGGLLSGGCGRVP